MSEEREEYIPGYLSSDYPLVPAEAYIEGTVWDNDPEPKQAMIPIETTIPELIPLLQPGKKVRLYYNEGNSNNAICYIRAIVDSEYIVYRVWSKRKRDWSYGMEWIYACELAYKGGYLTKA